MSTITCKIWIITAPWYDERASFAWEAHSKRAAIKAAVESLGRPWPKLKREGWRCVRAVVTWAR